MAETRNSLNDLVTIMTRLRDPQGGCEWDLAQTFASIAPYTILRMTNSNLSKEQKPRKPCLLTLIPLQDPYLFHYKPKLFLLLGI